MHPDFTTSTVITENHLVLLAEGGVIYANQGNAALELSGDRYVMVKRQGNTTQIHTLHAASTPAARLNAHWQQFAA